MSDDRVFGEQSPGAGGEGSFDYDSRIADMRTSLNKLQDRLWIILLPALLFVLAGIALLMFGPGIREATGIALFNKAGLIGVALLVYGAIFLFAALSMYSVRSSSLKREIELLQSKSSILQKRTRPLPATGPMSYFDRLVDINITNLEAYYGLVMEHTNNSFFAAIAAGVVGFVLVATGIIVGLTGAAYAQDASYISTISGVLTEFIAGVFFYLYNRTVRQLKDYHDSLIAVQNILLSFKIVEDAKDLGNRPDIVMKMIQSLVVLPRSLHPESLTSLDGKNP